MDDLTAFLAARLDEDEVAAHKAASADRRFGGRPHWSVLGHGIVVDAADPDWGVVDLGPCIDDDALAEHIARHDPARVLRDVEATRALLTEHFAEDRDESLPGADCGVCYYIGTLGSPAPWPCLTLRAVTAAYSDHPDYRAEWKP